MHKTECHNLIKSTVYGGTSESVIIEPRTKSCSTIFIYFLGIINYNINLSLREREK